MMVRDGRVFGSLQSFQNLVEGSTPPDEVREHLPRPDLLPVAVGDPELVVNLQTRSASIGRITMAWLYDGVASVLIFAEDSDEAELMQLPADRLAVNLVRLISLHPVTPQDRRPVEFDINPLEVLMDSADTERLELLAQFSALLGFTLGVRAPDDEWLMAGLTGQDGAYLLEPSSEERWVLSPVSGASLYRRLTAISTWARW